MIELSVIIPSYSEAENLSVLLPRINGVLTSNGIIYEIIVVDTVSPLDDTEGVCFKNEAKYVRRFPSNTFGDAFRVGLSKAVGDYIIAMDGDGSHDPEFIPSLIEHRFQYDVVIASRYCAEGSTENPRILNFMSYVLNKSYKLVLGLSCEDVSNSFRLYNGGLVRSVNLRCDNFDIVEEVLVKMQRKSGHLRVLEVPFVFKKRVYGTTKRNLVYFIFTYLVTLFRLRLMD